MSVKNVFTNPEYEQDPRWSAVDEYTLSHLHPSSRSNFDALKNALEKSKENGLPDISAYPTLGKFLALQCRVAGAKHALEVGTLGGYTAIWIASMNPETHVTTVEVSSKHAEVARQNIAAAGLSDRITVHLGPGVEVLPKLLEEVEAGKREKFGFVFIDADKQNNWTYFDLALKMCVPRASLYVDNVVRQAKIVDEAKFETSGVKGARELIERVGKDERVEGVVVQTVADKNYDGFLMAVAK